jgi:hypothetical protein
MNLDIGKAFTFVGEDPNWLRKVGIGGAMVLAAYIAFFTIIGGFVVYAIILGYMIVFLRNVMAGHPQPLPEWDDWGNRMADGFKAMVVTIVYGLPAIVVYAIFILPSILLSITGNRGAGALGGGLFCLGFVLFIFTVLLSSLLMPIGLSRYAATGNLGEAFKVGEVIATFRQNLGQYVIIALIAAFAVPFVASIGAIACGVGALFTGFYAYLVLFHLYGQAHRVAQGGMQPNYGSPYGGPPYGGGAPPPYGGQRPF